MRSSLRLFSCLTIIGQVALIQPTWATCGGGGGGGAGGARIGGMGEFSGSRDSAGDTYQVPWTICGAKSKLVTDRGSLVVLWFPSSGAAVKDSRLMSSKVLTTASQRCVLDILVSPDHAKLHETYKVETGQDAVVLINPDGTEVGRVMGNAQRGLEVKAVEKLVSGEISAREKKLKELLDQVEKQVKAGDKSGVEDLQKVWAGRCLAPSQGKRAAKLFKQLGITVSLNLAEPLGPDALPDPDTTNQHPDTERLLKAGLAAELAGNYEEAGARYKAAVAADPTDSTALRYLGEFYRHQTGQWDLAGRVFHRILEQPSDPLARAVALHGLGKMTIHSGRFAEGLALFEESLGSYPLAITYRNLAVYWFSEKQAEKAAGYMRQALELDPDDQYNQIFGAVYLAAAGHRDEALAVAQKNASVLEASYNLAAIWAQAGDRTKAMELLQRHFYQYERYPAVRAMEMKEAREDYMFASLHKDSEFAALTSEARNAWMIGLEFCAPEDLKPVQGPPGPRM